MDPALEQELRHHEELYSGFAQSHFARPAVRAFRRDLVDRIVEAAGVGRDSRVLSLGCGIGDTESLLAGRVAHVHGFDLSPKGIEEARRRALPNMTFEVASLEEFRPAEGPFDAAIAIFFLHHMANDLPGALRRIAGWLKPNGVLYAIDPSRYRLAGLVGRLLVPHLMKKYQTEDERPLSRGDVARALAESGWRGEVGFYDFGSTPVAGLWPGWVGGYLLSRRADAVLKRIPGVRALGATLEIVARRA